jgi:hypothetical protein
MRKVVYREITMESTMKKDLSANNPTLWGGRFSAALDARIEAFNRSLPFDQRLIEADKKRRM